MKNELQKSTKELSNSNSRITSEIGKLKGQLTQHEQKLNSMAEEIETLKSLRSSKNPPTQDEPASLENQDDERDEETLYNVDMYNRYDSL